MTRSLPSVIPDICYREYILAFAGSRPGGRATFVSSKVAKPMLIVLWPFGFSARFADTGGAQTRYAQTLRTFSPASAGLLGHARRPGNSYYALIFSDESWHP